MLLLPKERRIRIHVPLATWYHLIAITINHQKATPHRHHLRFGVGVHIFLNPEDSSPDFGRGVLPPTLCNNFCAAGVNAFFPPPAPALLDAAGDPSSRLPGLLANRGGVDMGVGTRAAFSARFFRATRSTMRWCRSSRLRGSASWKGFGVWGARPRRRRSSAASSVVVEGSGSGSGSSSTKE